MLGRAGEDYVLRKEAKDAKARTERLQNARSITEWAVVLTQVWVCRKDTSCRTSVHSVASLCTDKDNQDSHEQIAK